MMIVNGVNIFPLQVEQTLMRIPGIGNNYLIELHEENFMDKLHVSVELSADTFQGTLSGLEVLHARVVRRPEGGDRGDPRGAAPGGRQPPVDRGKGGEGDRQAHAVGTGVLRWRTTCRFSW